MHENEFISWLLSRSPSPGKAPLLLGIGDDAAVVRPDSDVVVTSDLVADGTHFRLDECGARAAGRKACAVNLSDLAAMAAKPLSIFLSILLPRDGSADAQALLEGAMELAARFSCPLAGGDTNVWDGPLALSGTALGTVTGSGPLTRHGAQPGDTILVTGSLGGSAQGHHLHFEPRVQEALTLHERYRLHSCMDLSDGLALDLRRLCRASGCGAEVMADRLPISVAARNISQDSAQAQLRALGDGEDFELLFTTSTAEAERIVRDNPCNVAITAIGTILEDPHVWLVGDKRTPMPDVGYQHKHSS